MSSCSVLCLIFKKHATIQTFYPVCYLRSYVYLVNCWFVDIFSLSIGCRLDNRTMLICCHTWWHTDLQTQIYSTGNTRSCERVSSPIHVKTKCSLWWLRRAADCAQSADLVNGCYAEETLEHTSNSRQRAAHAGVFSCSQTNLLESHIGTRQSKATVLWKSSTWGRCINYGSAPRSIVPKWRQFNWLFFFDNQRKWRHSGTIIRETDPTVSATAPCLTKQKGQIFLQNWIHETEIQTDITHFILFIIDVCLHCLCLCDTGSVSCVAHIRPDRERTMADSIRQPEKPLSSTDHRKYIGGAHTMVSYRWITGIAVRALSGNARVYILHWAVYRPRNSSKFTVANFCY